MVLLPIVLPSHTLTLSSRCCAVVKSATSCLQAYRLKLRAASQPPNLRQYQQRQPQQSDSTRQNLGVLATVPLPKAEHSKPITRLSKLAIASGDWPHFSWHYWHQAHSQSRSMQRHSRRLRKQALHQKQQQTRRASSESVPCEYRKSGPAAGKGSGTS